MTCWEHIGIRPTADKKVIKRAYAYKLKWCNPEDNSEDFKMLRSALEEALVLAEYITVEQSPQIDSVLSAANELGKNSKVLTEEKEINVNEVDIVNVQEEKNFQKVKINDVQQVCKEIQEKIVRLYCDFNRRVNLLAWEEVLDVEELWNVDVLQNVSVWLFGFFAENHYISKEVYDFLDDRFLWRDNYVALVKIYDDQEFVDNAFDEFSKIEWGLGYQDISFYECTDIDIVESYFFKREHLNYLVYKKTNENATDLLNDLNAIKVIDPELYRLMALFYLNEKNESQSLYYCDRLIADFPKKIEGYLIKARISYQNANFGDAANNYKAALTIDEVHNLALKGLALCYLAFDDLFSAKSLFEEVLIQVPFDIEIRIQLVLIHKKLLQRSRENLIEQPNSGKDLRQIAESLIEIGNYDECIEFLKNILIHTCHEDTVTAFDSSDPNTFNHNSAELYYMLGVAYSKTKQSEIAVEFYETSLTISQNSGTNGYSSLINLGELKTEHGQYEEAIYLLTQVVEFTPNSAHALKLLADAQRYAGLTEEAIKNISQAIKIDSNQWVYYYIRSMLFFDSCDYNSAKNDLHKVIKAQNLHSTALDYMARCCENLSLFEDAIYYFKSAFSCDRNNEDYPFGWLRVACKIRDLHEAELAMEALSHTDAAPTLLRWFQKDIEEMKAEYQNLEEE